MQQAVSRSEPAPAPSGAVTPLEAQRVTPYLGFLFLLLSTATLFDGFDSAMFGFASPDVRASLGISQGEWGAVATLTRLGVMSSFVFLFFADRVGRRWTMMATIVGFTAATFATALVATKGQFIAVQFVARLFLTAEASLAVIMVGEEFPARVRGRSIAVLASLATAGVMLTAKLQPYVLQGDGSDYAIGRLGHWLVSSIQAPFGSVSDASGWRSLYALGVLPLGLVLLLRLGMKETRRFEAARARASERPKRTWSELFQEVARPWHPEYRRRTAIVALLWNCVFLVTGPSTVFWVIYARESLHLTLYQVGDIVFWGYAGGVAGSFVGGWLIDRIGRKYTCASMYVLAAIAIYMLYHVTSIPAQYVWMILTVFTFAGGNSSTQVYASELFPTEIRATGYGWTTNFAGRLTEVFVPLFIGLLIQPLGIPTAMAIVSIGPILGAALVLRYAPETRGLTLEQIEERLRPTPS